MKKECPTPDLVCIENYSTVYYMKLSDSNLIEILTVLFHCIYCLLELYWSIFVRCRFLLHMNCLVNLPMLCHRVSVPLQAKIFSLSHFISAVMSGRSISNRSSLSLRNCIDFGNMEFSMVCQKDQFSFLSSPPCQRLSLCVHRYQTGVTTSMWMAKRWGDGCECWWTSPTVTWRPSWRWRSGSPNCPYILKFQIQNSVRSKAGGSQ